MNLVQISAGLAIVVAVVGLIIQAIQSARRFGRFETEHHQMKADITGLKADSAKHTELGTSVQLLTQAMGTLQTAIAEMRTETREGRQETREAIAELKTETREAIAEIRQDLRSSNRRTN